MIKRILITVMLGVMLTMSVSAEETDPYREIFEQSGAEELSDALPDDTERWLKENGIDPSQQDWINTLSAKNVFEQIWRIVTQGAALPIRSGAVAIGIILIAAAFPALSVDGKGFEPARQAAALGVALTVAVPVWNTVSAAVGAIKGCGTFMLSFVPVFAVIVTASGSAVTAVSMSALLLGAAELVASAAAFAVLPMMGGYLAVSLCAAVSPLELSGVAESIKKTAFWVLALVSTVFVGILGIQTAVNSAADSLTLRTAKFIIGTSVPIAGTALSEAAGTLTASMGLLRSSVGIYGVVALSAILLPILIELLLWRFMLMLADFAAGLLGISTAGKILKAVDLMLSVLVGLLLLVGAMFIISLSVVIGASGAK